MISQNTCRFAMHRATRSERLWAKADEKPYEGTSLNFLYLATAFTNGLKELEPEFEALTGISVEFELLDEEGSVRKTQLGIGQRGRQL